MNCSSLPTWVPEYTTCNTLKKTAIVQMTNLGGMGSVKQNGVSQNALFDIAIPGGGFGDFDGCKHSWPDIYESNDGPCDPEGDTPQCRRYGGFLINMTDGTGGGAHCYLLPEGRAQDACLWGFGVNNTLHGQPSFTLFPFDYNGMMGNPFIKRIRRVACPASMNARSGCPALEASDGMPIEQWLSNTAK